jgi:2-polyprenyl-3-methyl-5-hydroxy-6-metoxy-1,4-benzoquinol methylase
MISDASAVDVIDGIAFARTETVACPLCGSSHQSKVIATRFGMTAMVAECASCRIGYQTPRPSVEACIAYMDWRWNSQHAYVTDNPGKRLAAQKQLSLVTRERSKPGRLLDFGSGSGVFVRIALDAGWDAVGIEHSQSAIDRAKVFYDVNLKKEIPYGDFDVITLWDVIEHLKNPIEILSMLRDRLAPGGVIFLTTGNYESWIRRAKGDKWDLYLFDHHYYFTPSSLAETLKLSKLHRPRLLETERRRPSIKLHKHPRRVIWEWLAWLRYRHVWPEHFDLNEMTMVAHRDPS